VLDEISEAHIFENDLGVKETDRVSEWVMDSLDDAPMKTIDQLKELATESLQFFQKNKNYCNKSLFAALIDFYRWALRYG